MASSSFMDLGYQAVTILEDIGSRKDWSESLKTADCTDVLKLLFMLRLPNILQWAGWQLYLGKL